MATQIPPSALSLIIVLLIGLTPASAMGACPDASNRCIVDGVTQTLSGVYEFEELQVINGGRIEVESYDGGDKLTSGNLQIKAKNIYVDASSWIFADGRGYQGELCNDGPGPVPGTGGRGGCSVRDSGGGGAHFGGGGRGTKDCFIVPPSNSCQFPEEWEEDVGTKTSATKCSHPGTSAWTYDGLPSVAGIPYPHSIYEVEFGSAGGDKGCGDGWDSTYTGGAGGGRIVLAGLREDKTGTVVIEGKVTADGWRGCGRGNDSAGGGAGGVVLIAGDSLTIGSAARLSAEGGLGGDTQNLPHKDQSCPPGAQTGGTCDDCGGGGGGGAVALLAGAPATIAPTADFDVNGSVGGSCTICSGEAGGGAGELQLNGVYIGEYCDGYDNDFDGQIDEGLGDITCGKGACLNTVPACNLATGSPSKCLPPSLPECADTISDTRPRLMVIVDTSGSMLLDLNGNPTFGDGSQAHPGIGGDSRLYLAKQALVPVFAGFSEIDYALARFTQFTGESVNCQLAAWLECGGLCCSYDNPANNTGTSLCAIDSSIGLTNVAPNPAEQGEECINYSGWCGAPQRGADVLVGFGKSLNQHLMWLDQKESNFQSDTTEGDFCDYNSGSGDCELRATGPTPLAGALGTASEYIAQAKSSDPILACRTYSTILLTDGTETCLGDPANTAAELLDELGVETYVIGFTVEDDEYAQLNTIANKGSESGIRPAYFVNTQSELAEALAEIIAESLVFERCNSIDDDCDCGGDSNGDGVLCGPGDEGVDEDFPLLFTECDDGGVGACRGRGSYQCAADESGAECVITLPGLPASEEECGDLVDNDCDGIVDEGCINLPEMCNGIDDDEDPNTPDGSEDPAVGQDCGTDAGSCVAGTVECDNGAYLCVGAVGPASEQCDDKDNDCDGVVDGVVESCFTYESGCAMDGSGCKGVCQYGFRVCQASQDPFKGWGSCVGDRGPDVKEICDGLDNDCDASIDEDIPQPACYPPGSGSSTGCLLVDNEWECTGACASGLTTCQNGNPSACAGYILPAAEACDGQDNDCDGEVDEGLLKNCGSGCTIGVATCEAGVWVGCDLSIPEEEICDSIDNDCDGTIDEAAPGEKLTRECSSICGTGSEICVYGEWVNCSAPSVQEEGCDAQDNDCDGDIDEELEAECFNACGIGTRSCTLGAWGECTVEIGEELCDGIDNDCDGVVDLITQSCESICGVGERYCQAGVWTDCSVPEPSEEICDDIDNDCDGLTDEADEAICDNGSTVCFRGECYLPCDKRSECFGDGEVCLNGACVEGPCAGEDPEKIPLWEEWECIDPECEEVSCPDGSVCSKGFCVEPDCYVLGCDSPLICIEGECLPDPCAEIQCETGQGCVNGECFDTCETMECEDTEQCVNGECIPDPCAEADCPNTQECIGGFCVPDTCEDILCPEGRICVGGACEPDPCLTLTCPEGESCNAGICTSESTEEETRSASSDAEGSEKTETASTNPLAENRSPDIEEEIPLGPASFQRSPEGTCNCRLQGKEDPPKAVWILLSLFAFLYIRRRWKRRKPRAALSFLVFFFFSGCTQGSEIPVVSSSFDLEKDAAGLLPTDISGIDGLDSIPSDQRSEPVDGCIPSNAAIEICDLIDNDCDGGIDENYDLKSDSLHCGACGQACSYPMASGICAEGLCSLGECDSGWSDLDGQTENGCEVPCEISNGGIDICDGEDNDCDGITDNDFDLNSDPKHCGSCGRTCSLPNALSSQCKEGECFVEECAPGWTDLDGIALTGCEADCVPTNDGQELCDNEDNDCDGVADDGFFLQLDPLNCGACGLECSYANAEALCVNSVCTLGQCNPGFTDQDLDASNGCEFECLSDDNGIESCNGEDDDCDGTVDEGFRNNSGIYNLKLDHCGGCGQTCFLPHSIMQCSDIGTCEFVSCEFSWQDANQDLEADGCEYACLQSEATVDICNNLDDDCDTLVDEDATGVDLGSCYPYGNGCIEDSGDSWACSGICQPGTYQCIEGALVCIEPTGPAVELCDDIDNDCDTLTDEAFNIVTDLKNCGSCSNDCTAPLPPGTLALNCLDGACVWGCQSGSFDLDGDLVSQGAAGTGCEYNCTLTAPANTEFCDGLDNDCDGLTDEAEDLFAAPTNLCNNQAGSACENAVAECTQGPEGFGFGYYCSYPDSVETFASNPNQVVYQESVCDGQDGDCDGAIDEGFVPAIGFECTDDGVGACQGKGFIQCEPEGGGTYCEISEEGTIPLPESCDGIDNDCDGLVDEREDQDGNGAYVEELMARVENGDESFAIYIYEASRPDATTNSTGTNEARSCSRSSVLPWSAATLQEAISACENAGLRLCTKEEWALACQSSALNVFPYGNEYNQSTCNGLDAELGSSSPAGSLTGCTAVALDASIYDLSGNLKEWVDDGSLNNFHQVRGGSYESPQAALRCDFDFTVVNDSAKLNTVGFRCCGD